VRRARKILERRRSLVDGFGLPVNMCEVTEKIAGNMPIAEGIERDSQNAFAEQH